MFQFWPLILIALGGYLIYSYMRPSKSVLPQSGVQTPPPAQQVVVPPEPEPVPEMTPVKKDSPVMNAPDKDEKGS